MKVSTNFVMQEFLPQSQYNTIMKLKTDKGKLAAFYRLVNPKIVELAQFIREFFNAPIVINNWHSKGTYENRGWRPENSKVGARYSQHKLGNALDFDVKGLSDDDVKKKILANQSLFYQHGARRMESGEDATTWCHLDIRDVPGYENKIYVFRA